MVEQSTLTSALRAVARDAGDSRGLTYRDASGEQTFSSYAELDERARVIADALAKAGYSAGDAAVIGLRQGVDWVVAVHGVLYAGMAVVPVVITGTEPPERIAEKIASIAHASDAAVVITDAEIGHALTTSAQATATSTPSVLLSDLAVAGDSEAWVEPEIGADSHALLLFTSGSTGDPKGVVATHESIVREAALASRALGFSEHTVFGGWLPLYHSMGLTLQWFTLSLVGASVVLTAPELFQRRPMAWLRVLSDFGATASAASNFAFELCTKFATDAQVESLDLSRLQVVVSAGEPVHSETVKAFADRFAPAGFRSAAVTPAIGMTETMLYCGKPPAEDLIAWRFDVCALEAGRLVPTLSEHAKQLTSCGRPFPGVSVRIADPETHEPVSDGQVGEIWVSSPALSIGYLGRPDLTAEAFGHALPGDDHRYLRTGDLGAMMDGELFVTGRLKDVIIVRGRNIYPQDMEVVARPVGLSAAFELEEPSSGVGIIIEFDPVALAASDCTLEELATDMRSKLTTQFAIPSLAVGFVEEGSLLRTPSGKVQRRPTRAALRAGRMPVVYSVGFSDSAPRNA